MDDDVVPMMMCPHCEHLVPEENLTIHEARCQGRKRPARDTARTSPHNDEDSPDDTSDSDREHHRSIRQNLGVSHGNQEPFSSPARRRDTPCAAGESQRAGNNRYTAPIVYDSYMSDDELASVSRVAVPEAKASGSQQEVIDLVGDESEGDEHWYCPRCTLQNSLSSIFCEACSFRRPETERPPDEVRRERLIGQPRLGGGGGLIGGATLLGGVLGGTGAYLRGQSLSSGLLNGAMTGAFSGAVLNELARNEASQGSPVMQQQSQTFLSTRNGPTMQSISILRTPDGRVMATRSGSRTSSTALYGGGGGGGARGNSSAATNPNHELNQLLSSLIAHQVMRNRGGAQQQNTNPDQMSYEQLLQMFGSGTENMAAGESQIRSLPSATIRDVDKLPPDSRACSICLEDFKNGDERKIMPCLHGFHASCLDKWLRSNGSCPICKHRLEKY